MLPIVVLAGGLATRLRPVTETLPAFARRTNSSISCVTFTPNEVLKHLTSIDPNKTQGPDGIHPLVLRNAATSLHIPLAIIFKQSLDKGELPQAWLDANVTPIHKKGSKLDPANYRPISLTSVLVKILEKLVKSTLMQHLTSNNLISDNQHGFVNQRACVTNLLETADFLTAQHADKIPTYLILLDFAKAFDKVPHRRLIHKLEGYGIQGKLLSWIRAFLSNRKQRVCLGNFSSNLAPVTSSVPQGSVLGPTLFIIYINDLVDLISNRTNMYADDTKILSPINCSGDVERLQNEMDNIIDWTNNWLMKLNIDKCKVMHFGKHNPQHTYTMTDYSTNQPIHLETTEVERDLGIQLSSNLKVSNQCKLAANRATFQMSQLKNNFISRDALLWKRLNIIYIRHNQ